MGGIHVVKAFATRAVAVGAAAALGMAGAIAPASAEDGVTKNKITLGMTTPLTGPAAPGYKDIYPAAQAYFDYVNANGGINGRDVEIEVYDDQYNPAKTKIGTSQLINRDNIFAMYGALGTATHSAVVRDLNRRGIPDIFVNTGAASFDNPRRYPTTFPYFPSYIVEAKTMAYYIDNNRSLRNKTRCLMYQDGEFGDNAKAGFKAAGMDFEEETSYYSGQQLSPLTSQVSTLRSAGCELVVFFGVTSATANLLGTAAKAGFRPTWMVTSVGSDPDIVGGLAGTKAILNGVYAPSFLHPIQDTRNPYVRQMKVIADRADLPWNFYTYYGINTAYVLAQAIEEAGPNLTRKGLIRSLERNASDFRSAASVPMRFSKSSHQGLTGYWMGQYDDGLLERETRYVITATSSSRDDAKRANYRPKNPTRKLLP